LGNLLSRVLYRDRKFDQAFFDRNAAAGEIMVLVVALFPLYWVWRTAWWLVPVYFLLILAHLAIFMPTQCEKCSYHHTCPGGQAWLSCRKYLGKNPG
jgi:cell division protein FtsW (lipid II flippase)